MIVARSTTSTSHSIARPSFLKRHKAPHVRSPRNRGKSTAVGGGGLVPPHDIEAEESVLGALLLSGRVMQHLALEVGLREDDFYRERHSLIYAAMCALLHAG